MKKRFSALICLIAICASALCSCKPKGDDTDIPLDVDMNSKPVLKFAMQASGMDDEEFGKEYTAGVIERLTGYKVQYTQLKAENDGTDDVNTIFRNKTPYHAIKVTKAQYNSLVARELLLDIKPALERYGQDMLSDISEYSWGVVSNGGGIYGIPEGGPPTPGQNNVDKTILFRTDLILDYGMNLPKTRDEFVAVLRKFKEKNPDCYPFTFSQTDSLIAPIAVSFGILQEWTQDENGEWKYYIELPEYKQYMEFMKGLYNEGLIDISVDTQDKAAAIAKFGQGKSIAIALGVWDTNSAFSSLQANGNAEGDPATDKGLAELNIDVVKGFTDPNGVPNRTFHSGGYSYVTVIPYYMAEEAAYTVDHLNKKIKEENFKEMMIGKEGTHYEINNGEYRVLNPARFKAELYTAASFATGVNEKYYPEYFLCRIDGQVVKKFFTYLNENSDKEAAYNPLNFTSILKFYDEHRIELEGYVTRQTMRIMFTDEGKISDWESVRDKWKNDGGNTAKAEIKKWCEDNDWDYWMSLFE